MIKLELCIFIGGLAFLTGCSSFVEEKYEWKKAKNGASEYSIVNAVCKSESYRAVPIPSINLSGCEFMDSGFSRGFCSGSSSRHSRERTNIRNEIYDGCMVANGWEKVYEGNKDAVSP
jgi:hypothetical protein